VQREATVGDDKHRPSFVPVPPPRRERVGPVGAFAQDFFRLANDRAEQQFLALIDRRLAQLRTARGSSRNEVVARWESVRSAMHERLQGSESRIFSGQGFFPTAPIAIRRDEGVSGERQPEPALWFRVEEFLIGRVRSAIDVLRDLAYLGPLREAPRRFQLLPSDVASNVGARGENTALLLARDSALVQEVNRWLKRLNIPYDLGVEPLAGERIGLELDDLIATVLKDRRSGITVTPQDVGFGISQLLPVVVQMLVGRNRTVCVEQPEIHVHPRLQAEVADLIIAAADPERGNQVLVETHSEHLMLRLQRRLRERDPDWLTPNHIAIVYVNSDQYGVARPVTLRLDENGHFIDEWPDGFFPERLAELFAGEGTVRRRRRAE
jgi:hypothetical protein